MLLDVDQFIQLYNSLSEQIIDERNCTHSLALTRLWLRSRKHSLRDNIKKIIDLGGHCDCEVLWNVDPDRWAEKLQEELGGPEIIGQMTFEELVNNVMAASYYQTSLWSEL